MCTCLCVCMGQCRHAYVGQQSRLGVFLHHSSCYYFDNIYLLSFMCTTVLPTCIYMHNMCISSTQKDHKTTLDLLELVIYGCGTTMQLLCIKPGSSVTATGVLNHQAISTFCLEARYLPEPRLTNWLHWWASKPWELASLCTALSPSATISSFYKFGDPLCSL